MNKQISEQQLKDDFKQVVLYFNCETIHKFFDDDPKKLFQALADYMKVRSEFLNSGTKVSKERYFKIIRNLIRINYGIGIPRDVAKAMFRRGSVRTVKNYIDEMLNDGEIFKVIDNGRMPTKEKKFFTKKYLLPIDVLEDFFADKKLAEIKIDNRKSYWSKRQNRFIGNELDRRKLEKKDRAVCAAKKQEEQEDAELKAQVDALFEDEDI